MTTLQRILILAEQRGLSVVDMLNLLQEHGVISDNCVTFRDVPEGDAEIAEKWLLTKSGR